MIAGTIRNAVNQMQLVNDWEQKKATGDVVKKQEGMTVTSQEEIFSSNSSFEFA